MKRALAQFAQWLAGPLRRPVSPHLATGRQGEREAARHLRRAGYRLVGRNLRSRLGEIDLLAMAPDGRTVVFVEVKSRRMDTAAGPADTTLRPEVHVNEAKRRKIVALAAGELRRRGWTRRPVRFDIIGVDLPGRDLPGRALWGRGLSGRDRATVRHHVGAFVSPF